jgi:hypothetical protein
MAIVGSGMHGFSAQVEVGLHRLDGSDLARIFLNFFCLYPY